MTITFGGLVELDSGTLFVPAQSFEEATFNEGQWAWWTAAALVGEIDEPVYLSLNNMEGQND